MHVVVPGHPIGKGRPRFDSRSKRAITPKRTREYEVHVCLCTRAAMDALATANMSEPLVVTIRLYWKSRVHSDVDNCAKALLDGMQGVAFLDDKQVRELHVYGGYDKDNPRAEVRVERWRMEDE